MKTENDELRQLDAWIAGNVMEMKVLESDEFMPFHHEKTNGFRCIYSKLPTPSVRIWNGNESAEYRPTTNDADAMAVLNKCREKVRSKNHDDNRYTVRIDCDYPFMIYQLEETFIETRFRVEGETLPLAICLFAKALFEK